MAALRDLFTAILDSVALLKEVRITEPWIKTEILESVRERDSWLRISQKDKHEPDHYEKYRKLRKQGS